MLNQKIKAPLWVITIIFVLSSADGAFGLGISEGLFAFMGLIAIASLVWMWVIVNKYES